MTMSQAKAYKKGGDKLFVAPLAVIGEAPEKVMIIHDRFLLNPEVLVLDQGELAMAADIQKTIMIERDNFGDTSFLFSLCSIPPRRTGASK